MAQWIKNLPTMQETGDVGSTPGSGKSPGERNGNPLPYSRQKNPMDRGVWWATVNGVTKSQTELATKHDHDLHDRTDECFWDVNL